MAGSSQKFIARNRAPRVQIEYDVELYGAEKKVQLPFVMGVMSDLSGKSEAPQPSIADRKFLEIDVDNFDDRMKSMKPRAAFTVPNTLTGEGNLAVDVTFESMDDFSPAAIARKVEPLRKLLEARTQLSNLMTYMDGKTGAEALLERVLGDRTVLAALAGQAQGSDAAAALDALRRSVADLPAAAAEPATGTAAAFDAVKAAALPEATPAPKDESATVLQALRDAPVLPEPDELDVSAVLVGLHDSAPKIQKADPSEDILAGLRTASPEVAAPLQDAVAEALAGLRQMPAEAPTEQDGMADALAALRDLGEGPAPVETEVAAALDALRAGQADATSEVIDSLADALGSLRDAAPAATEEQPDAANALAALRDLGEAAAPAPLETGVAAALDALRAGQPEATPAAPMDPLDDVLSSLRDAAPAETEERPDATDALAALRDLGEAALPDAEPDPLADLLASFDAPPASEVPAEAAATSDLLEDMLADFGAAPEATVAPEEPAAVPDPLDDLLADFDLTPEPAVAPVESAAAPDPLDDLLASFDAPKAPTESAVTPDPLDDLLADFNAAPEPTVEPAEPTADADPLDDLLASFDAPPAAPAAAPDPLDDLLASFDAVPGAVAAPDPLADLMSEMAAAPAVAAVVAQDPFGRLSAPAPTADQLRRPVFRMAILGDFTGRAARGVMEIGPALAKRRGIKLDVDTLERVIEGMATTLVLPIGSDGAGIEVRLNSLDDLHPDELYENVELFSELASLRQRLSGSQAEAAMREMAAWGGKFDTRAQSSYRQSSGSAVPADRKLGDFQRLIGDHEGVLHRPSPAADLIARIVGPHVMAAPSADVAASKALVDAALSDAMRLVLHHPEFQQIEVQWRTLEFLARRIETDTTLQVVLYDISAEELAADLAAGEDLAQSGLFGLLADEPLSEGGAGGFSAVIGLYTFEETPPHAELLARMARIAGHVEAPFVAAIAPGFLDTPKADRHPLVAAAWEKLRAMPEARYLGLASPRVMLRHPYGKRSEPIDRFAFEEFTLSEGLSGMLWANPAALVAVLLGAAWSKDGARMQLGGIMTLGDIPFHTFTDAHGDQVALPCTERNLTLTKMEEVVTRGFMPVVSIRGRDQVRLASFQSLGGGELCGPWSAAEGRPARSPAPVAQLVVDIPVAPSDSATAAADELDALLAGFGNEAAPTDPGAIDADLAALLEGL